MRSIAAQRHRINRAINFALAHLSEPVDLEAMADVACLSKFHFTRVFTAHLQETPFEFLTRTRLELAARKLAFMPQGSVTLLAFNCGFSNPQSFSRAFRRRFGFTPTAFRSANTGTFDGFVHDNPLRRDVHAPSILQEDSTFRSPPVSIVRRPPYLVAYLRHRGSYSNTGAILATYLKLHHWTETIGLRAEESAYLGISHSNAQITPARSCIYDVCVAVPDGVVEDDVVSIQRVPGGVYAVMPVKLRRDQIAGAWEYLLSHWLPDNAIAPRLGPHYEYYPPAPVAASANVDVELCLAVRSPGRGAASFQEMG